MQLRSPGRATAWARSEPEALLSHGHPEYAADGIGRADRVAAAGQGRTASADTVCITKTENPTALNKPESFSLAIVPVDERGAREPRYIREPFQREPDFGVTGVNYKLAQLLSRGECPS